MDLQVLIEPTLQGVVDDAVSFETGLSRAQASDPELYAYEHHGAEFTAIDPGALTSFFEDLALGRPMPLKFATPAIQGVDTLFAITAFLHRDIVTHPSLPGILASVDLAHRRGVPMYGHIDPDLARFLRLLGAIFPANQNKAEQGEHLRLSVAWIYDYVTSGTLPHLGPGFPIPQVINVGSNGFVFAHTGSDLHAGWVELYRQGFLRGLLVSPLPNARHQVLGSRKSVYVPFNLSRAASLLNEVEMAMGEPAEWKATELWLHGPPDGTLVLVRDMLEILARV